MFISEPLSAVKSGETPVVSEQPRQEKKEVEEDGITGWSAPLVAAGGEGGGQIIVGAGEMFVLLSAHNVLWCSICICCVLCFFFFFLMTTWLRELARAQVRSPCPGLVGLRPPPRRGKGGIKSSSQYSRSRMLSETSCESHPLIKCRAKTTA